MKASWRSTLAGIVAALALIIPEAQTLFDDDPATNPNFNTIFAALGVGAGLGLARDNGVNSKAAGAE